MRIKGLSIKLSLFFYDFIIFAIVDFLIFKLYMHDALAMIENYEIIIHSLIAGILIFACRIAGGIYHQIWRYGGIQSYIRLMITDAAAFVLFRSFISFSPERRVLFVVDLAFFCMNLLGAMSARMIYRFCYKFGSQDNYTGKVLRTILKIFAGHRVNADAKEDSRKIKIAIVGAGRVGASLAQELLDNPVAAYSPICFIDNKAEKTNRSIYGIPVFYEDKTVFKKLQDYEVQEIVFAIPQCEDERRKELYEQYKNAGYKIKNYDYPVMESESSKRTLRDFDVEDLLFRKPIRVTDDKTNLYYKEKTILITGGGGSIGSELGRQISKMHPKQLIVLDVYENGAYDLVQELKRRYANQFEINIEICSVCDNEALRRVFEEYHPQIVIHAAAHKHVPLMEKNCIEAIRNNVFGTYNLVQLCEEYQTERFMMVSTDKAVNPTNVMGATKRMCEMIVLAYSEFGNVKYSCTRFGNVLGSAGSVIPLFRRQIAAGGPVTITDKRIIRYFMTIPEASQLVLQSGAMADNGELFVLDMGQPVKILDLAENMIRLSGIPNIEIIETGLRPGEKLFEELLVKTEELDKTDNSLIFIERDEPITREMLEEKLAYLAKICDTGTDDDAREALRVVVPTFAKPEEVNEEYISK